MASLRNVFQVNSSSGQRPSISKLHHFKTSLISSFKPVLSGLQHLTMRNDVSMTIKNTSLELLDAFVHMVFEFEDQPLLPSQSNFAPVEELGEEVDVGNSVEGRIPEDFPEGVYMRNGSNPLFGGFKTTKSIFGRTSHIWVEGEGMIHALYLKRDSNGSWTICYNNRHVETETFKLEKERNKPCFLPAIEGHPMAILSAFLLNLMRFGQINKVISNTNVFEHSGKYYAVAESELPQEIDINTLKRLGTWDINGAWRKPFTSHPKRAPGSGELVMMGIDAMKPFFELGVISADGSKLVHRVDLKFPRSTLCHDIGVTQRYNVILDFQLTIDINRVFKGARELMRHDRMEYARIGVMPRYGDANSVKWFEVEASSVFHIINCFEDNDEVIMWACRAAGSIIPGPDLGLNKFEWFCKGFKHINLVEDNANGGHSDPDGLFFSRAYEWRLNMKTGEAKERNLTGTKFSMEFPMINENFVGLKNTYGYTQLVDSEASSTSGMAKYGGLAKLHFQGPKHGCSVGEKQHRDFIKVEYHKFPTNTFCSGAAFVPKFGGLEEDDGWIITFVHNEHSNVSQVYIIDAKKFSSNPVAIVTLPSRVPYGFHGVFMPISS